jgi:predicted phosphoadenosine phosphosulfate sulfurtransferase
MGNIVKRYGEKNVVEAAKTRIKNVFDNNLPVYMSFSGGKDSICMADLVYKGVVNGSLDANLLKVVT